MAINLFNLNGTGSGGGASTVHTANGISGDGSVATPVVLGGNPLTTNTQIALGAHQFELFGDDGAGNTIDNVTQIGNSTTTMQDASGNQSESQSTPTSKVNTVQDSANNLAGVSAQIVGIVTAAAIAYANTGTGQTKQLITSNQANTGIQVVDNVDNRGLEAGAAFALDGNPGQYVQAGNVAGAIAAAAQDTAGQTTSQTIPPPYTPLVDSIVRLNAYAFVRAGTGGLTVSVTYTDVLGTVVSQQLSPFTYNLASGHTIIASQVIKVKGGTPVLIQFNVTGTLTYDAGGTIENLFT